MEFTGPAGSIYRDSLLDTGSDDTVLQEMIAGLLGIDLSSAPSYIVHLAGRGPVHCRYAKVSLRISDGQEAFAWSAIIGFVPANLHNPLLGFAGFLQFFNADFRGADRQVNLTPNHTFPGQVQQKTAP